MDKHLTSLLLFAAIAAETSTAFVAPKVHSSAPREIQANGFERTTNAAASSISSLSLSSSPDDNSSGSDSFLKARTDIRNFLTQRSIQSFVYLLNQCREEHTVRWLEVSRALSVPRSSDTCPRSVPFDCSSPKQWTASSSLAVLKEYCCGSYQFNSVPNPPLFSFSRGVPPNVPFATFVTPYNAMVVL